MKKITLLLMLMTSLEAFSCKIERLRSETHLTLDPSFAKAQLTSKANLSSLEVTGCDGTIPFLMIGSSVTYHQNDAAKRETLLADIDPSKNNCSVQIPKELQPFKTGSLTINNEAVLETVKSRKYFIDACLSYEVSEFSGRRLEFDSSQNCKISEEVTNAKLGSLQYNLDGQSCLVKVNRNTNLKIKARIKPACLGAGLLTDSKLKAQDIETNFNIWPAQIQEEAGQKKLFFDQTLSSRPVRYTIVPSREKITAQKAMQRYEDQPSFVQVSAVDVDFAKLEVSMIGAEKYAIQPTFFVQNDANNYCDAAAVNCFSPSEFVTPIAADMELYEVDRVRSHKTPLGRWMHAVKVPARFAGMLEVRPDNNLSGTQAGALVLDRQLAKGKSYLLTADFYEPRAFMDNDSRLKKLFSGESSLPVMNHKLEDGAMPALPGLGVNTDLQPMAPIMSNKLNEAGFEFFVDRANMKLSWTNYMELACNSQKAKCISLAGNKPFIRIKVQIEVLENGTIKVLKSQKESSLYGSYNVDLSQASDNGMMKKVCK